MTTLETDVLSYHSLLRQRAGENTRHRTKSAEPDRSEIGPYLRGHWATSRSPATNPTSTHLKWGILNAAKGGKNNCR